MEWWNEFRIGLQTKEETSFSFSPECCFRTLHCVERVAFIPPTDPDLGVGFMCLVFFLRSTQVTEQSTLVMSFRRRVLGNEIVCEQRVPSVRYTCRLIQVCFTQSERYALRPCTSRFAGKRTQCWTQPM